MTEHHPVDSSLGFTVVTNSRTFYLYGSHYKEKAAFLYAFACAKSIAQRPSIRFYEYAYKKHVSGEEMQPALPITRNLPEEKKEVGGVKEAFVEKKAEVVKKPSVVAVAIAGPPDVDKTDSSVLIRKSRKKFVRKAKKTSKEGVSEEPATSDSCPIKYKPEHENEEVDKNFKKSPVLREDNKKEAEENGNSEQEDVSFGAVRESHGEVSKKSEELR